MGIDIKKIFKLSSIAIVFLMVAIISYLLIKKTPQIGIIAALPQELDMIIDVLDDKEVVKLYDKKVYKGKIGNINVIAMLGDMGKVNASISSQLLMSNFKLDTLIVTGLAGGLNSEYEIGDIVFAKEVFQHDYGFLGENGFVTHSIGSMPEIGIGVDRSFFVNTNVIDFDIYKDTKLIQPSFALVPVDGKNRKPQIHSGVIATGDQFIANDKRKSELIELGADLVEMEGAAIAQVALLFNVPILIIRTISDKAGFKAKLDFPAFIDLVSENNAKTIVYLLQSEILLK